jgi:DinB superfamily
VGAVEEAIAARAASLERSFRALEPWLELSEPGWSTRPAPDSWSPAEIVEHLALMQHFVLLLAEKIAARGLRRSAAGAALPTTPSDVSKLQQLAQHHFRWTHPEHMTPRGGRARDELRRELDEQRARCLDLLRRTPRGEGALHRVRMSVVGERLDLYQFLALVDLHLERHLAQLERAAAALNARTGAPRPRSSDAPGT